VMLALLTAVAVPLFRSTKPNRLNLQEAA
jgi:hypothetical protein